MKTINKIRTLSIIAGLVGWVWMIAGVLALYYFIMAIGFDGSWYSFFIALAVSAVAKWLCRGFYENRDRVAFEADMVARGMTPQEAEAAWLHEYSQNRNAFWGWGDIRRKAVLAAKRASNEDTPTPP